MRGGAAGSVGHRRDREHYIVYTGKKIHPGRCRVSVEDCYRESPITIEYGDGAIEMVEGNYISLRLTGMCTTTELQFLISRRVTPDLICGTPGLAGLRIGLRLLEGGAVQ